MLLAKDVLIHQILSLQNICYLPLNVLKLRVVIAKSGMGDKLKILMGNYNKVFYDWGCDGHPYNKGGIHGKEH